MGRPAPLETRFGVPWYREVDDLPTKGTTPQCALTAQVVSMKQGPQRMLSRHLTHSHLHTEEQGQEQDKTLTSTSDHTMSQTRGAKVADTSPRHRNAQEWFTGGRQEANGHRPPVLGQSLLNGLLRLRLQSRPRMRLRIAASIAFLFCVSFKGVLAREVLNPTPSKPHLCNMPQAKMEFALQSSESCTAEVALQYSLFCSADILSTKSCAVISKKLQRYIEKLRWRKVALSCDFLRISGSHV